MSCDVRQACVDTTKTSSSVVSQMYTDHNMTAAHFPTHQAVDNAVAQVSQSSSETWIKNCMALAAE